MAMYTIAVTPLIRHLCESQLDVSQVWFADDATAAGQLAPLLHGGDFFCLRVQCCQNLSDC